MTIISLSVQTFLFINDTETFQLEGRAIATKAPEWLRENKQALRLLEEEKVSFEVKQKPKNRLEELRIEATKLNLKFSDEAKEDALEELIKTASKKDAKK